MKSITILAFAIACTVSFASISDYETQSTDNDVMKNRKVFEGDILVDKSEDRDAVQSSKRKWLNGIVPYVIDSKLKKSIPLIKSAMKHIENRTLIKFVKRTNEQQYISFIRGKGSSSHIGRRCSAHLLTLGSKCSKFGIIVHELMRAMHHKNILPDKTGDEVMENPEVMDLFEGDILGIESSDERHAVGNHRLWPSGRIPYTIDPKLKSQEPLIKAAMKHYADKTCIQFVPRTDEMHYVRIFPGRGCFSNVGNTFSVQSLSLGPRCFKFSILLHELGHTIGFFHEHSRVDRDRYLNIHYDNIQKGLETQFMKFPPKQNQLLTPFDFDSVMLYGETVFSKNHYNGLKTMTAKNGRKLQDITEKTGLSDSDIERINKLYRCLPND